MRKLLKFLKGYYKESILAPTFKMLEAIFELLVPIAVQIIIDDGINGGNANKIWLMCGAMLLLALIGLTCAVSAQFFAARAAVGFATKLRSALFKKIQRFSYPMTDKIGTSTLINRMTSDVNAVQTGVNMFLRLFMRSPFIVFGAMICALIIDVKLGLIFIGVIIILAIIVFGIMLISISLHKKEQKKLDNVVSKVRENYNGVRVVRAFNKETAEIKDFDQKIDAHTKLQRFTGRISALMNPLTYLVINFAIIILIKNGAMQVDVGGITQGELVALFNYMSQILVELVKLASLIITLNKASASAQRISNVFDMPDDVEFTIDNDTNDENYAIKFENVCFKYSKKSDDNILNSISFSILEGQTVGIIGGTGSGKTTLINVLSGFYHADSGSVYLYGKNVDTLDNKERQKLFGIVPQKASLFEGTVKSNLLLGDENATDEELWDALQLAQAKDFVKEKPEALEQKVAQGGSNFSGGQKQRLTIARALVRKPKILILDDSASALDYATEAELRKNIISLSYKPTTVIVSQRASSIMHADLIIVLDDGIAVGMGTHSELLDSCEVYREIYNTQFAQGGMQK